MYNSASVVHFLVTFKIILFLYNKLFFYWENVQLVLYLYVKNQNKKNMKKLGLIILICICSLMSQTSYAQVSIRANISLQPIWGPVGYDYVEYYYLPDVEAYYYVPTHMFFYMENGRWVNRPYLSGRYRNFDLYNARKYVINEPRPYLRNQQYRTRYANARGYNRPMSIRDSHDSRYYVISNHPQHSQYNAGRGRVIDNRREMNNRPPVNRGTMNSNRGAQENRGNMNNNRGTMNNNRGAQDNRGTMNNNRGTQEKGGAVNNNRGANNNRGNQNNNDPKRNQNQERK
jgi:hypothetical protein